MNHQRHESIREAVAVFEDEASLEEAIDSLLSHGCDRADISLLASEQAVAERLGHTYEKVSELEDDPKAPRTMYVERESLGDAQGGLIGALAYVGAIVGAGAVVASGGAAAAAIGAAAAAGGTGGVVGAFLARLLGSRRARTIQDHIAHGGLLLWVRVWDAERAASVGELLTRAGGKDVHIHTLVSRREYASTSIGSKRMLVALFETKGDAENCQRKLLAAGFLPSRISIDVLSEIGPVPDSMDPEFITLKADPFFWFLGDLKKDYAQYIRNGETTLSLEIESAEEGDRAAMLIEAYEPVRVDAIVPGDRSTESAMPA